jgi:hypothetical protein
MSEQLTNKIRASERCGELMRRIPAEEHRQYALGMYRDLTEWLAAESDGSVEERYTELGLKRAQQEVPFSNLFWAVCIAREYLWEYIQQECLLDEPVEFWGGVNLLHSLNHFFDRALYFTLIGYQQSGAFAGTLCRVP